MMGVGSRVVSWVTGLLFLQLVAAFSVDAQSKQGTLSPTKEQILEGAKKEGKLRVNPGHDDSAIPTLVKAFEKKYPFIQTTFGIVTGIEGGQRQLFEMTAGSSSVDAFSPSSSFLDDYFKKNLLKAYDFRGMAKTGQLKIPEAMIDESGLMVWLGTNTGVLAYNGKLVPADKAPKSWDSCLDPYFKNKFSVDTKPNILTWLTAAWGEEKLLAYAKQLKANSPVFGRGNTRNITMLASGEVVMNCGMYIHTLERVRKQDPSAPIKMVTPNPFPLSYHEPEAVYVNSKNPNAALLWIEWLASKEGQELVDSIEPGRGSFLVEGTLAYKLAKGANASICGGQCRHREDAMMERIAVEAWGLPKVGAAPK